MSIKNLIGVVNTAYDLGVELGYHRQALRRLAALEGALSVCDKVGRLWYIPGATVDNVCGRYFDNVAGRAAADLILLVLYKGNVRGLPTCDLLSNAEEGERWYTYSKDTFGAIATFEKIAPKLKFFIIHRSVTLDVRSRKQAPLSIIDNGLGDRVVVGYVNDIKMRVGFVGVDVRSAYNLFDHVRRDTRQFSTLYLTMANGQAGDEYGFLVMPDAKDNEIGALVYPIGKGTMTEHYAIDVAN